ncbi:hypothetical protein [Haloquadratum walsbyi]|nr:hypothetical protein [Haloquadratum walsbyi]
MHPELPTRPLRERFQRGRLRADVVNEHRPERSHPALMSFPLERRE